MIKIYGKRGNPKPIPDTYDQSTKLMIYDKHYSNEPEHPMATGKWTEKGFLLEYGSLIIEDDNNEQYVKEIKKDLENDGLLEYNDELGDYSLCADIYLHSPSTAGRLVKGHTCNGHVDWKNSEGVSLEDLTK